MHHCTENKITAIQHANCLTKWKYDDSCRSASDKVCCYFLVFISVWNAVQVRALNYTLNDTDNVPDGRFAIISKIIKKLIWEFQDSEGNMFDGL